MTLIQLVIGFALLFVGGYMAPNAGHQKPESKGGRTPMTLLWHPHRFTDEGVQVLRRSLLIQVVGVFVIVLAIVIEAF